MHIWHFLSVVLPFLLFPFPFARRCSSLRSLPPLPPPLGGGDFPAGIIQTFTVNFLGHKSILLHVPLILPVLSHYVPETMWSFEEPRHFPSLAFFRARARARARTPPLEIFGLSFRRCGILCKILAAFAHDLRQTRSADFERAGQLLLYCCCCCPLSILSLNFRFTKRKITHYMCVCVFFPR